ALAAVRAAAPRLRTGGSVTLSGGLASRRPASGLSLVASVMGAMEALTRALAVELAPLRGNLGRPGPVRTALWSAVSERGREGLYQGATSTLPVEHVGEAEEIAQAYLYCMTQSYATGAVIPVDGGGALV